MTAIIDRKYITLIGMKLPLFKRKQDNVYNFRCPFCGDSQKNKVKARGYVYLHKAHYAFKCHNCHHTTNLAGLIEHVDSTLYRQYGYEKYSAQKESRVPAVPKAPVIKRDDEHVDWCLESVGAIKLNELLVTHYCAQYVKSRKIPVDRYNDLYFLSDTSKLEKVAERYKDRLPKDARLIIPFRSMEDHLIGVTCRDITGASSKKYIAVRMLDQPMVYGLNRLDLNREIFIIEGPIDSMFVDNGIAVGGSDLFSVAEMFDRSQQTLVFDNQPRNKELVQIVERAAGRGYRVVIWPESWPFKDINEAIINNVSSSEVYSVLNTNRYQGLSLNLAIRNWKKCA